MTTSLDTLTAALRRQQAALEDDLRDRVEATSTLKDKWVEEYREAQRRERTAASWQEWRDERVVQAAAAWVLTTVFIRFCEDNRLVEPVWIAGPEERRQEALDAQLAYFRRYPEHTDQHWLLQAVDYLAAQPATAPLVDTHSALRLVSPSGDAARGLLAFWREKDDSGALVRDLADPEWSTRFLGDLYQHLSEHAQKAYALLQTPEFVEEFILDRTLEPALAERPLEGFRLIDPACGSGHFLLGAFARLLDRWHRHAPGLEVQARVQTALDAVHGVDINPFAVAIARFRLTVAALKECGWRRLEQAPAFHFHLAVGDSLLHGPAPDAFDFGPDDRSDLTLVNHVYSTEDLRTLRDILQPGRYDVVVGNPPYITVKDKKLNKAYRRRYRTCHRTYALTVPFMERFFQLAKERVGDHPAGWVGQITSNSFMKREFGVPLIEQFLPGKDLRLVADTSGAYLPGHGTPTVIIAGKAQPPATATVRAVLGIRSESVRPAEAAEGVVWRSIADHVDDPGHDDGWTSTTDLDRSLLAKHPWSLTGGGAVQLRETVERSRGNRLDKKITEVGFGAVTREDSAYMLGDGVLRRNRVDPSHSRPLVEGEVLRDWSMASPTVSLWPYSASGLSAEPDGGMIRLLWPYRTLLSRRVAYGQTQLERELRWYEYSMFFAKRYSRPLSIAYGEVATHNHFVLDRGGKVFKQTAPVIKLPEVAKEDAHLELLGVLNSSTACFWLKQVCHDKGSQGVNEGVKAESWERFYAFNGSSVLEFPLPGELPVARARRLDEWAQELGRLVPAAVAERGTPTRTVLDAARAGHDRTRARMIAEQEELDWEVYRLYGLVDEDLTYKGDDLPELALGERAFEIALARRVAAGEEETAWFARHGSTPLTEIPERWPVAYRELVARRLELIESDRSIGLLERPEYKRRWQSEPWDKREREALRDWLLDRLEAERLWFDRAGRPTPRSVAQLADEVARDQELSGVLALWAGRPDAPVQATLVELLADQAVPFLAAYRYKPSGMRKREAWEHTWDLQRREDRGEELAEPIPVPPKYTSADFARPSYWQHRGKLDVPKERFILYQDAGRGRDPTPLLGWAGWDHAQQALALNAIYQERVQEGWPDDRLLPIVAGLAELQPWVEQWHPEVHPTYGVSLAVFCRELLTEHAAQVGATLEDLAAWRPEPARRGRRTRTAGAPR